MAESPWRRRIRRVPLLGGLVAALMMLRDIYDTIGWTDPAYHSVRSSQERLDEARRVAAIGAPDRGKESEMAEPGEGETGLPVLSADQQDPEENNSSPGQGKQ